MQDLLWPGTVFDLQVVLVRTRHLGAGLSDRRPRGLDFQRIIGLGLGDFGDVRRDIGLGLADVCLGGPDIGFQVGRVLLDNYLPGADKLAFAVVDRRDPPGNPRRKLHILQGRNAAGHQHRIGDGAALDRHRFHRHGRVRAARPAAFFAAFTAAVRARLRAAAGE